MNTLHNPAVPFTGPIPQGMFPGRIIKIQGTVPPHSEKFAVNLLTTSGDIALHVSPNFHRGCIVRNSVTHMNWGHEEHHGGNPVHRNQYFDMVILCEPTQFKIAFNNHHFTEFQHRVSYTTITNLAIDGQVSISLIAFEGAGAQPGFHAPNTPHQPGVVPYPPGGAIHTPHGHQGPYPVGGHVPHQHGGYPGGHLPPGGYPGVAGVHLPHDQHGSYPGGHHASPYPVQPGYAGNYAGLSPHAQPGYYPSHSPTAHKKTGLLDKAGMAVAGALGAGALGASSLMGRGGGGGGHKYNKLGALGGGGLGAVLTGAALTGSLNPKKAMKKESKARKKALKYGLPIAGAGLGAYALHKGMHHMGGHHHHGHHGHHHSSSSSSSSSSD